MGYNPDNPNRPISKTRFIKPWQYLVTQMGVCFSMKIINHHEVSYRLMDLYMHLYRTSLISNIWSCRPFLVYPRFTMRVINSQLGFGGIPALYPIADVVLQQSIKHTMLIPTDHNTGLETHLCLFHHIIYREDEIELD
ncbi:hypothetical protein Hanom_Chr07g00645681 [Helianthus anomalus]